MPKRFISGPSFWDWLSGLLILLAAAAAGLLLVWWIIELLLGR